MLGRVLPQDSPRDLSVALTPSLAPWLGRGNLSSLSSTQTRRALQGTWVAAVAHACGQVGIAALSSLRLCGRLISSACCAACRSRPAISVASALVPWRLWKWLRDPVGRRACSGSSPHCPFGCWKLQNLLTDELRLTKKGVVRLGYQLDLVPRFIVICKISQPKISKLSV